MNPSDPRSLTAYHEAGHLAVACHYQLPVIAGTIQTDEADRELGHVLTPFETLISPGEGDEANTFHLITYYLAGVAAEQRFAGTADDDAATHDREQAWRLARELARSDRAADALIGWLRI